MTNCMTNYPFIVNCSHLNFDTFITLILPSFEAKRKDKERYNDFVGLKMGNPDKSARC